MLSNIVSLLILFRSTRLVKEFDVTIFIFLRIISTTIGVSLEHTDMLMLLKI